MMVPFGLPVVPEVNKQYAALSGVAIDFGFADEGMRSFLNACASIVTGVAATSVARV
jgi:hypothetical protein